MKINVTPWKETDPLFVDYYDDYNSLSFEHDGFIISFRFELKDIIMILFIKALIILIINALHLPLLIHQRNTTGIHYHLNMTSECT